MVEILFTASEKSLWSHLLGGSCAIPVKSLSTSLGTVRWTKQQSSKQSSSSNRPRPTALSNFPNSERMSSHFIVITKQRVSSLSAYGQENSTRLSCCITVEKWMNEMIISIGQNEDDRMEIIDQYNQ